VTSESSTRAHQSQSRTGKAEHAQVSGEARQASASSSSREPQARPAIRQPSQPRPTSLRLAPISRQTQRPATLQQPCGGSGRPRSD